MSTFAYDERTATATIVSATGRVTRVTNVTRARAERFYERYKAKARRMAERGERGDPLTFTGPDGIRGG